MLRAIIGTILIVVAVIVTIILPDGMLNGQLYELLVVSPLLAMTIWPLLAIPALLIVGSYLSVAGLVPRRYLTGLIIGWIAAYITYMIILESSGPRNLLEFEFHLWHHFLYLLFIGAYVGIVFHLQTDLYSYADIYGAVGGFLGWLVVNTTRWKGPSPRGFPSDHPLNVATFIVSVPIILLLCTSLLAMGVNLIRALWWEIRRYPAKPWETP
jgi:hypothetical protein